MIVAIDEEASSSIQPICAEPSARIDQIQGSQPFLRLSVSLPAALSVRLDAMMAERGLLSRSQVIAELIRHEVADFESRQLDPVIAGTITLIYSTESGRGRVAVAQTQSAYLKETVSSQHVFLENDQSLEVMLVQGPAARIRQLCDDLRRLRSVQQIKLVVTSTLLPSLHAHGEAAIPDPGG